MARINPNSPQPQKFIADPLDVNIALFRGVGIWTTLFLGMVQLFIESSLENMLVVASIVGSTAVTYLYCFRRKQFQLHPFSAFMVLGNNFTMQLGALLFQTLYWRPLTYNLDQPVFTFTVLLGLQAALLLAHWLHSRFSVGASSLIASAFWDKMGLFKAPSISQLFLLGLIGCVATFVTKGGVSMSPSGVESGRGMLLKVVEAFMFLVYLPPVLLVLHRRARIALWEWGLLGLYFVIVLLLGLIGNSRGFFATYPVVVILLFILGVLCGRVRIKRNALFVSFAVIFAGTLLILPLSNLAIAMELVRSERGNISYAELVRQTWNKSWDTQALQDYIDRRSNVTSENHYYSEIYFENPFLNRLVVVKYQDNMLGMAKGFSAAQRAAVVDMTMEKNWAILPNPILVRLKPTVSKVYVTNFSMGDYFSYLSGREVLGSFRLGSLPAHAYVLFGFALLPALVCISIVVFIGLDSFCLLPKFGPPRLAILALGLIWPIFTLYSYDSLLFVSLFFLRTVPQSFIIYWLIMKATDPLLGNKNEP